MEAKPIELDAYINVVRHNGRPALQLRRLITDRELIKIFLREALEKEKVNVNICFNNKMLAIAKLREEGLI